MKKITLILIASIGISLNLSAQTTGDYRSIANGNWNDATKWERFNGSSWVSTAVYPGQLSGAGVVTIMKETAIKLTASVPNPVGGLTISIDDPTILAHGILTFSAENAVSLSVSGNVIIGGKLNIDNQIGSKTHNLLIGGNLQTFDFFDYSCICYVTDFQTINQDDKLGVTFNSTDPGSLILSHGGSFTFQDITINGMGIMLYTNIFIAGTATFINGYVYTGKKDGTNGMDITDDYLFIFLDGATISGASNASFIDGMASKSGVEPFTFPIGNDGLYAPVTISGIDQPEQFYASYSRNSIFGQTPISDPGLYSISECEYWYIFRDANYPVNPSIDVTVSWTSATRCGSSSYISNASDVVFAHFDGISWYNHSGTGTGTSTNGSVTWSGFNFVGLTLGNLGVGCKPPSSITTSGIGVSSATASWPAVPGAISYDVDYRPSNSQTWINAATTLSPTANLTGLLSVTNYDLRVRANCGSNSSSYRQSQFTTLFDCGVPSGLSADNVTSNSATLSWAPVVNVASYRIEYKKSTETIWTTAVSGITTLSHNLNGLLAATVYDWRVVALCPSGTSNYTASNFITLPQVCNDVYEPNNGSGQAKAISSGNIISAGITQAYDADWFKITTPNSSSINLEVTIGNLPADYDLFVYDRNLKLKGSSTKTLNESEAVIINSAARNSTYYIKVISKVGGVSNNSQCYNLQARLSSSARAAGTAPVSLKGISETLDKQLLYPNPATNFVNLSFNSTVEGPANLQIVNNTGQLIKQISIRITKGQNQVKIPVNDIATGMYQLIISKGELNLIRRLVIAK